MDVALIVAVLLVGISMLGLVRLSLSHIADERERMNELVLAALEQTRLSVQDAMNHVAARSVGEKLEADAKQELLNLQLEDVREAYVEEKERRQAKQIVRAADGREIELGGDWVIDDGF